MTPLSDFYARGLLANLKCWHRLTEGESDELVRLFNDHIPDATKMVKPLTDEQTELLADLYRSAAKITGSAFLAGEKCPKDDVQKIYRLACEILGGISVLYHDLTGAHPELHESAHNIKEGS
jgi:hypothetical protein